MKLLLALLSVNVITFLNPLFAQTLNNRARALTTEILDRWHPTACQFGWPTCSAAPTPPGTGFLNGASMSVRGRRGHFLYFIDSNEVYFVPDITPNWTGSMYGAPRRKHFCHQIRLRPGIEMGFYFSEELNGTPAGHATSRHVRRDTLCGPRRAQIEVHDLSEYAVHDVADLQEIRDQLGHAIDNIPPEFRSTTCGHRTHPPEEVVEAREPAGPTHQPSAQGLCSLTSNLSPLLRCLSALNRSGNGLGPQTFAFSARRSGRYGVYVISASEIRFYPSQSLALNRVLSSQWAHAPAVRNQDAYGIAAFRISYPHDSGQTVTIDFSNSRTLNSFQRLGPHRNDSPPPLGNLTDSEATTDCQALTYIRNEIDVALRAREGNQTMARACANLEVPQESQRTSREEPQDDASAAAPAVRRAE